MKIFQPVGQIRLTNVATVKLKSHGLRFEVACYRNKILSYRAGMESDLDEVLQTAQVFTNVSKGQFAKQDELMKAFGTTDVRTCCQFILEKGELQVSKEERQITLEAIFKDVCTIVTARCINPTTGLPVTSATVANALNDCGFSTHLDENTKKQALRAIDLLCTRLPDHICRAPMRTRITALFSQKDAILQKLHELKVTVETEDITHHPSPLNPTRTVTDTAAYEKSGAGDLDPEALRSSTADRLRESVSQFTVVSLCDPNVYRSIDGFVRSLSPPAALLVVTANVTHVKPPRNATEDQAPESEEPSSKECPSCETTVAPNKLEGGIRCSSCDVTIEDRGLFRKHCRTEWHIFNVKRSVRELDPITEDEFNELKIDIRNGFLAVE